MFVALAPPPSTANHSLLHGCNELMAVATVSAFSGAMGSVLAKLAALLADDFKLAKGAKKDIVSLRDEMSSIGALLARMDGMEALDAQQAEWRRKVRTSRKHTARKSLISTGREPRLVPVSRPVPLLRY